MVYVILIGDLCYINGLFMLYLWAIYVILMSDLCYNNEWFMLY